MASPTVHQNFQGMPQIGDPVVDPATGSWTIPWQQWAISIWQKLGGNFSSLPTGVFLQQTTKGTVTPYDALSGKEIGTGPLVFGALVPTAQEAIIVGPSPATLAAASPGTLAISGTTLIELSRPPGAFVHAGTTAGALLVLAGDEVRLTWAGAPVATFFPFSIK